MGFVVEQLMNPMLFNAGGADVMVYLIVVQSMGLVTMLVTWVPARRYPDGLVLSPDGQRLYVAENLADSLAVEDPGSSRIVETLPTGRLPYSVAAAADGTVLVSAWGGDAVAAFAPDDRGGFEEVARVEVGRHPPAILLNAAGTRLFVASASTDRIAVVDTAARRVIAILRDPTPAGTIEGSTPTALADADDSLVVNGKGRGAGPNPLGPQPVKPLERDSRS